MNQNDNIVELEGTLEPELPNFTHEKLDPPRGYGSCPRLVRGTCSRAAPQAPAKPVGVSWLGAPGFLRWAVWEVGPPYRRVLRLFRLYLNF